MSNIIAGIMKKLQKNVDTQNMDPHRHRIRRGQVAPIGTLAELFVGVLPPELFVDAFAQNDILMDLRDIAPKIFLSPQIREAVRISPTPTNYVCLLSAVENIVINLSKDDKYLERIIRDISVLLRMFLETIDSNISVDETVLLRVIRVVVKKLYDWRSWNLLKVFLVEVSEILSHICVVDEYYMRRVRRLPPSRIRRGYVGDMLLRKISVDLPDEELFCLLKCLDGTLGYVFFDFSMVISRLIKQKNTKLLVRFISFLLDRIGEQHELSKLVAKLINDALLALVDSFSLEELVALINDLSRTSRRAYLVVMGVLMRLTEKFVNACVERTENDLIPKIVGLLSAIKSNQKLMRDVELFIKMVKLSEVTVLNFSKEYRFIMSEPDMYLVLAFLIVFERIYMNQHLWSDIIIGTDILEKSTEELGRRNEIAFILGILIGVALILSSMAHIDRSSRILSSVIRKIEDIERRIYLERPTILPLGDRQTLLKFVCRAVSAVVRKKMLSTLRRYMCGFVTRYGKDFEMFDVLRGLFSYICGYEMLFRDEVRIVSLLIAFGPALVGWIPIRVAEKVFESPLFRPKLHIMFSKMVKAGLGEIKTPVLLDVIQDIIDENFFPASVSRIRVRIYGARLHHVLSPKDYILVGRFVDRVLMGAGVFSDSSLLRRILNMDDSTKGEVIARIVYHVLLNMDSDDERSQRFFLDMLDSIIVYNYLSTVVWWISRNPYALIKFIEIPIKAIKCGKTRYLYHIRRILEELNDVNSRLRLSHSGCVVDIISSIAKRCIDLNPGFSQNLILILIKYSEHIRDLILFADTLTRILGKRRIRVIIDTLANMLFKERPPEGMMFAGMCMLMLLLRNIGALDIDIGNIGELEKKYLLNSAILFGNEVLLRDLVDKLSITWGDIEDAIVDISRRHILLTYSILENARNNIAFLTKYFGVGE